MNRCMSVTSIVSSGGDDRRVLLWHMEKAIHGRSKPVKLKGEHRSNIFCLAFDSSNTKVFSGGESRQTRLMGNVHVNKLTHQQLRLICSCACLVFQGTMNR